MSRGARARARRLRDRATGCRNHADGSRQREEIGCPKEVICPIEPRRRPT